MDLGDKNEFDENMEDTTVVKEPLPEMEDRIDESAIDQFETLGYTGRLPDSLVATYQQFKIRKDRLTPGPLSPEGIVMVLFLAGFIDKEH
ncbi:MAG: hypothetical protein ACXABD_20705 [Candidatus Thorarchaeota archaeon]|jgi:hypothetical protein